MKDMDGNVQWGYRFRFEGMRWYFTERIDDFGPDHTAEIQRVAAYVIKEKEDDKE